MTYDANHHVISSSDANGNTTTFGYTGNTMVRATTPGPVTGTTTKSYNALGELVQETSPLGVRTAYYYDAAGNLTNYKTLGTSGEQYNGLGPLTTYDEAGDKLTQIDQRGNTAGGVNTAYQSTWTFDAAGNLLSVTQPGQPTSSTTYDAAGDPLTMTDPNGNVTSYSWNEGTSTQSVTQPGGTSTHTYDAAGHLLADTAANAQQTTYVYDVSGRKLLPAPIPPT